MSNIAFIPARSGSKRLKDKNITKLLNLELFLWSVRAAARSKFVDRIIFSTDSYMYRNICEKDAKKNNYQVSFDNRSEEEAGDKVKIYDYIKSELTLERNNISEKDRLILMLPTCPLRFKSLIDNVISLSASTSQSVFTCCEYDFHVSFAFLINENKGFDPHMGSDSPMINGNTRSQDQKTYYHPNGSIYSIPVETLIDPKANSIYFNGTPYLMDAIYSCDVDTKQQFTIAESVASALVKDFDYILNV